MRGYFNVAAMAAVALLKLPEALNSTLRGVPSHQSATCSRTSKALARTTSSTSGHTMMAREKKTQLRWLRTSSDLTSRLTPFTSSRKSMLRRTTTRPTIRGMTSSTPSEHQEWRSLRGWSHSRCVTAILRDNRKDLWRTPHKNQQTNRKANNGGKEANDINTQQYLHIH